MTLLTDFPNTAQIVSTLFVLIVVNAALMAAVIGFWLDLKAYRRFHIDSVNSLRESVNKIEGFFMPEISGSKTIRNIDPGFYKDIAPEMGLEEKGIGGFRWTAPIVTTHVSGRADPLWSGHDSFMPPIILGNDTPPEKPDWKEGERVWWGNVPAIIISDPEKSEPNIVQIALESSTGPGVTTEVVRRMSLTKRHSKNEIDEKLPGLYPTSMEDNSG